MRSYTFTIAISMLLIPALAKAGQWQSLVDGISYQKTIIKQDDMQNIGFIHAFQIDPSKFRLDIITADQFGMKGADVKTFVQKTKALLTINGGFFTPEHVSLGLLIKDHKEINKLKKISWWHIFQIKNTVPSIVTKQDFQLEPEVEMAIEAGPRLLIDGEIPPKLKPNGEERTALGITSNGLIIIAVTERAFLSLTDLAREMARLGCHSALNLDGGSSTQLFAKIKNFELHRPNLSLVANGIGVFPRIP